MAFPTATVANQTYIENGVAYLSMSTSNGSFAWVKSLENPLPQYVLDSNIAPAYYEADIVGNGTQTVWSINHALNTDNPMVVVRGPVSGTSFADGQDFVTHDTTVTLTNLNTLSITTAIPVPNGVTWRVAVVALDLLGGVAGGGTGNFITTDAVTTAYYEQSLTGNGSTTSWPITHDLDSGNLYIDLRSPVTGISFTKGQDYNKENASVTLTGANSCTVVIDPAIPNGVQWKLGILGVDKLNGIVGGAFGGGGGGAGVSDHGDLTGLSGDDHPQYALSNGSRGAFEPQGAVATHAAALNPHPQYLSGIADGSITTTKYADNSVSAAKLQSNAVGPTVIQDGAVGTAKIANSAVDLTKIAAAIGLHSLGSTRTTAPVNVNNQKITGLADPTVNTDAVNYQTFLTTRDTRVAISHTVGGALNLNWASGNMFKVTATANITSITESNKANRIGSLWITNAAAGNITVSMGTIGVASGTTTTVTLAPGQFIRGFLEGSVD